MSGPDHHYDHAPRRRSGILTALRNNFLAGLVVVAPIGMTFWLVTTVLGWVDGVVWPFIPQAYHPQELINRLFGLEGSDVVTLNVRGVGVILFLVFTVLVGWIAKGLIGRSFIRWGEGLVERMPIIRSVYGGVKQIAETVFSQSETSFDRACLVEYPRPGLWAVGFVSTSAKGEIAQKVPREDEVMTVFLPTTPNPTSGFLLFVPKADVIPLDMSVEDAAKLVISAGLVYPADKRAAKAKAESAAKAARQQ